jgi:nucleoid-associated protein YgaU
MRVSNKLFIALTICLSLLLGATLSIAQEMTMDEYHAEMAKLNDRVAAAEIALENCNGAKADLAKEIEELQAQKVQVWEAILAEIGTDEAGVEAFLKDLKALDAECDGLLALSPEELFKKREDVCALASKLDEAKKNKISALTKAQDLIAAIEGKLTQIKDKMPAAMYNDYTVIVGDYLWKISGKEYGDPMQWMKIYSVNKDQIKDADLIFPEQVFKILQGKGLDQYIVEKGDFLQKIAENPQVLGDPASWTKIYEKNKDVIGDDPSLIFPHTVLVIPQ